MYTGGAAARGVFGLAIAGVLGACGGDGDAYALRSGVHTIYAGMKADDYGCTEYDPAQCPTFEGIFVADVDVDDLCVEPGAPCGRRIAVLTTRGGGDDSPSIHVSDDGAVTWRTIVPEGNLYSFGWDSFSLGVHLQAGEIYLLFSRSSVGAGGLDFSRLAVARVDPVSGALSTMAVVGLGAVVGALPQKRDDGQLRWILQEYDHRDGSRWPQYGELHPTTGEVGSLALTCADGRVDGEATMSGCEASDFSSPNRGDTFDAYRVGDLDVCRYTFDVGEPDGHSLCVPRRDWAGTTVTHTMPVAYLRDVPYGFWSDTVNVRAAGIVAADAASPHSGAVTAPIELGPGKPPQLRLGRMQRPRWAHLVAIEPLTESSDRGHHDRFVELGDPNGGEPPSEVVFSDSPCGGASCGYEGAPDYGYRLVQWLRPWSADEYLVFYVVQHEANDNQQTLYVSLEKPTRQSIVAAPPPPFDPELELPPVGQPDLLPMTPLERACIRLAGCGLIPAESAPHCVSSWLAGSPVNPGLSQARAAFMAATTCEELAPFAQARPNHEHCGTSCMFAGGDCIGGIDASDDGGTDVPARCTNLYDGPEPADTCLPDGSFLRGRTVWGEDERYAVACADFGLTCAACPLGAAGCVAGCVDAAQVCASETPTCEGDLFVRCTPGTQARLTTDCSVIGAECTPANSGEVCVGQCPHDLAVPKCFDQFRISVCVDADPGRYADCRSLGFSGCEDVTQTIGDLNRTAARCW